MKAFPHRSTAPVLAGLLIAGTLTVGTAHAAPVPLRTDRPTATATAGSGSADTGSVSSSELSILRVLLLCGLGLQSGRSCNLMP
jgi:hypothetical protein